MGQPRAVLKAASSQSFVAAELVSACSTVAMMVLGEFTAET